MVKLFFDTEFTDLKQDCDLISIGIVAVDTESEEKEMSCFYAESIDYSQDKCSDFVVSEILPHLILGDKPQAFCQSSEKPNGYDSYAVLGTEEDITHHLIKWMHQFVPENYTKSEDGQIDIWGDCLAYDWVLFNHLFEDDGELPRYINYIPFDISTMMKLKGVDPDISREEFASISHKDDVDNISNSSGKHNSLYDAMIIYYCYDELESMN